MEYMQKIRHFSFVRNIFAFAGMRSVTRQISFLQRVPLKNKRYFLINLTDSINLLPVNTSIDTSMWSIELTIPPSWPS